MLLLALCLCLECGGRTGLVAALVVLSGLELPDQVAALGDEARDCRLLRRDQAKFVGLEFKILMPRAGVSHPRRQYRVLAAST